MISRIRGTLLSREGDRVEVATPGGVVYEAEVPLSVAERLPALGAEVELRTVHLVREDAEALYGFLDSGERQLFLRLIGAKGVGGKLAIGLLSAYPAPRLARALREKDLPALMQVTGVGRKTAERILVELSDRMGDLVWADPSLEGGTSEGSPARDAVQALLALGMTAQEAELAVRAVLEEDPGAAPATLLRAALARRSAR
jgi:holliday junction DNA helicase RuvA